MSADESTAARGGPVLAAVRIADDPRAWSEAGFAVEGSTVRLGPLAIECTGAGDPTPPAFVFDRPHPGGLADLDGIEWVDGGPRDDASGGEHPNGIGEIDHVVVMATSLEGVRAALAAAGLEIRRERPTKLGATAITQVFAWAGDVLLEIVAPDDPATQSSDPASTVWGLAAIAHDLDATAAWFGDRISAPRDAVQAGRRIATVRHRELGCSLQLAVMTPR